VWLRLAVFVGEFALEPIGRSGMEWRAFKLGKVTRLSTLALALCAGCSTTTSGPVVTINATQASGSAEIQRVGGIVVGCFEGGSRYRAAAEQRVAAMLRAGIVGNRNLFDVFTAPEQARNCIDVARNTGASAVFSGVVSRPSIVTTSERSQRVRKNSPGKPLWVTETTQSGSIVVGVRALEVDSGAALFEHSATGKTTHRYVHGKGSASSQDALVAKALDQAVKDIRKKLLPTVKKVVVKFRDDCSSLTGSAVASCQSAISFLAARPQRLDRACNTFGELADRAANNLTVQYNMGLCAEADGAIEIACEFYMNADSLTSQPDPSLNLAIQRNRCQ